MDKPLAIKLRPNSLNDIIGQKHLVGKNKILSNLVKNKKIFSMILYGPPGIGKTSIANAIANDLDVRYRMINAVNSTKKDIDVITAEAKLYDGMVVIVDEIHRLNKDKQDLLLPILEDGLITLIGLTTSNPYHKINPAIRSRCQLFELHALEYNDIIEGLNKAVKSNYLKNIKIDNDSINYIANLSGSDLRYAYNLLEVAYYSTNNKINIKSLKEISNKVNVFFDKDSDGHYNLLSAFQKSIRGSDVDASLHYLSRLIEFGDLDSIYRRMSVIAYEDIGLANPSIGPKVNAAINLSELVGLPECRIILSEIIIEMALSPKSNSSLIAIDAAIDDIRNGHAGIIPQNILPDSKEYKYPHNYKNNFVKQQYLPIELKNKKYYVPHDKGYEINIKKVYDYIEKLKK